MRWDVWIYDAPHGRSDSPRGRWAGCVDGENEQVARHVAIIRFTISPYARFGVSERSIDDHREALAQRHDAWRAKQRATT